MSKECFCGCGRRVPRFPLGIRSINTRGRQVVNRLDHNHAVLSAAGIIDLEGETGPAVTDWFDEGQRIAEDLSLATHGELDPNLLDERSVRDWQARGRELERLALSHVASVENLLDEAADRLDLDFLDEELDEDESRRGGR